MSKHSYTIEAWNQPQGYGHGWASCKDRDAEMFFVFRDGSRIAEFRTRERAERWIAIVTAD